MTDAAEISFDKKQWEELLKSVRKKWAQVENRKEFGGLVSASVFQDVIDHFNKEKGPDGSWTPWSKSYREHMVKIGKGGNRLLQDSGRLRQTFTPESWTPNSDGILFYNNAKTKTGFPYAYAHDNDEEPRTKLPRRAFMWLSDRAMNNIVDRVTQWLEEL